MNGVGSNRAWLDGLFRNRFGTALTCVAARFCFMPSRAWAIRSNLCATHRWSRNAVARWSCDCQAPLLSILSTVAGIDQLVSADMPMPAFDVHAPLLSLPGIFQTKLVSVPTPIPYLHADPTLVEYWRRRLEDVKGLKVGIAWQGNAANPADRRRSIPLACFAPLANVEGVQLISLQKGPGAGQLRAMGRQFPVLDLGEERDEQSGPFMDTAAIMMNLDLVMSSDTAIPHLAGSLGVPVWVALPLVPDWRWLLQREDSPWYPAMRLFRQSRYGQWGDVFDAMAEQLGRVAAEGTACRFGTERRREDGPGPSRQTGPAGSTDRVDNR